ncbi:MAG: carotenoid 1,2-hydratase [Pseudomonadota bacterium]
MTERPKSAIERTTNTFAVGPSRVDRTSDGLSIRVLERGAPLPRAANGTVEVRLPWQNTRRFQLHPSGRHTWQPICTTAEVSVAFDAPKRTWTGRAYVDTNWGTEPLETGFDYWDWSRTEGPDGSAKIRYVSDLASGGATDFCVGFDTSGEISTHTLEPQTTLPPTPIWRIPRRAGLLNGETPELMRTLEDTPFYSRSLLNHPASGVRAVHESFSGKRLRSNLIKSLLMVRMPRR